MFRRLFSLALLVLAVELTVDTNELRRLSSRADAAWVAAWVEHREEIERMAGIAGSGRRQAHFYAQVAHESGGFRIVHENLNYSVYRLRQVWPKRFPTAKSATPYARNPEALANHVYGSRMGNVNPGDGWRFRGRGPIQLTGRDMYQTVGRVIGMDLEANPDLVTQPEIGWLAAAGLWLVKGCNGPADRDDLERVTRLINGGQNGLEDRRRYLGKARKVFIAPDKPDRGGPAA